MLMALIVRVKYRSASVAMLAACLLGLCSFGNALGQGRLPRQPRLNPRIPAARRAVARAAEPKDKDAGALLRQMLHPLADYSGEEQTWIAQNGGMTSRQTIKGDTKGSVIRNYESPDFLQGDIMVTGPNRYAYYHAATRTVTQSPPTGGQMDERDRQILQGLKNRIFIARRTGTENVAGINATIVLVTAANPQQQGYAKFWIDPATGIRLKTEIANAANSKISTSELVSLVVGPAANVTPRDFNPAQFGAGITRQIKRRKVASVQAAMAELPFHPLEPGNLPAGFRLAGVQIIDAVNRVGLFLRYTDGVSEFSLTEHKVRAGQRPGLANAPAPRWYVPVGDYDVQVIYRGHLPAPQEQSIHDSLQPSR